MSNENQDSADLESLFDSIIATDIEKNQKTENVITENQIDDKIINQIGHMTRTLHNTLRELGLNREIEKAASAIPDTRERLNYIADLAEKSATRTLAAIETATPIVDRLEERSRELDSQWSAMFSGNVNVDEFRNLVARTRSLLAEIPSESKQINAKLMEIMMAQDFQDLTGQVIKKIIDVTQSMENQLVSVLLEAAPADIKAEYNNSMLNGPAIKPGEGVVSSQAQVDDLLASLGF